MKCCLQKTAKKNQHFCVNLHFCSKASYWTNSRAPPMEQEDHRLGNWNKLVMVKNVSTFSCHGDMVTIWCFLRLRWPYWPLLMKNSNCVLRAVCRASCSVTGRAAASQGEHTLTSLLETLVMFTMNTHHWNVTYIFFWWCIVGALRQRTKGLKVAAPHPQLLPQTLWSNTKCSMCKPQSWEIVTTCLCLPLKPS